MQQCAGTSGLPGAFWLRMISRTIVAGLFHPAALGEAAPSCPQRHLPDG